jgi:hypothetical protein
MQRKDNASITRQRARQQDAKPEQSKEKEERVPVNLRLPASTVTRLKLHSLAEKTSASDIVAELIETHLRKHSIISEGD